MADDATRIRLEGEDNSGSAFASAVRRLKDLEREAGRTSRSLSGSASVFEELGKGVELGLGRGLRAATAGMGTAARTAAATMATLGLAATSVTAGGAALAAAWRQGEKESQNYRLALLNTGNALGMTVGQMSDLARSLKGVTGTQSAAAASLAALAATGRVGAENLGRFAETAVQMQRTLGVSIEKTASQLAALADAPSEASARLTKSARYLTLEVYNQIRALEEQGKTLEAASLAQSAWAANQDRITREVAENLGLLERAWAGARDAARRAWDEMLNIGRPQSLNDQLEEAQTRLRAISSANRRDDYSAAGEKRLRDQIELLQMQITAEAGWTRVDKERRAAQLAAIDAQRANEKWAQAALTKQQLLNRALEEYRRNNEKIRAAGGALDPAQVAREEAAIRKRFTPSEGGSKTSEFERVMRQLDDQIAKTVDLTAYEKVLADIEAGRLKSLTKDQREAVLAKAEMVDATLAGVDAAKAEAEMQKLLNRLRQDEIVSLEATANKWLDQIDPMRVFIRQVEEVDRVVKELSAHGHVFTPEQITQIKELGNGIEKLSKKGIDAAKELGLTFSSAFEDAIVAGKSFRDVLSGIEQDVLRMFTRKFVTAPMAGALGKFIDKIITRESGGPVAAGKTYLVGERGPELFRPATNGAIVPNHALIPAANSRVAPTSQAGARTQVVNIYVQTPNADSFRRSEREIYNRARLALQRA